MKKLLQSLFSFMLLLVFLLTACGSTKEQIVAPQTTPTVQFQTAEKATSTTSIGQHPTGQEDFAEKKPPYDLSEDYGTVSRTESVPHRGGPGLLINSKLQAGVYHSSEVKSYDFLYGGTPNGIIVMNGVSDLTGYQLQIQVWFNSQMVPHDGTPNYARAYSSDWQERNYYGPAIPIDKLHTDKWITITADLGRCQHDGPTYEVKKTKRVGLRIDTEPNNAEIDITYFIAQIQLVYIGVKPC